MLSAVDLVGGLSPVSVVCLPSHCLSSPRCMNGNIMLGDNPAINPLSSNSDKHQILLVISMLNKGYDQPR